MPTERPAYGEHPSSWARIPATALRLGDLARLCALAAGEHTPSPEAIEELAARLRAQPARVRQLAGDERAAWWLDPHLIAHRQLHVPTRCLNSLHKAGLLHDPHRLAALTGYDVLALRGFGWRSLVDLIAAQERFHSLGPAAVPGPAAPAGPPRVPGREQARALAHQALADPASERLPLRDPRLARPPVSLRAPRSEVTLADLARRILEGTELPWAQLAARVQHCLDALAGWRALPLFEELAQVVRAIAVSERNAAIVIRRLGLDGAEPESLETIGQRYDLTRERVRQIASQWARRQQRLPAYMPVLEAVRDCLAAAAPLAAGEVGRILGARGLVVGPASPGTVENALRLLGGEPQVQLEHTGGIGFFVCPGQASAWPPVVLRGVRQALRTTNAGSVAEVLERMAGAAVPVERSIVEQVVDAGDRVQWIDREAGYFWDPTAVRQPVLRRIVKLLAVAGPLPLEVIHRALARERRLQGHKLPVAVVRRLALCAPGVVQDPAGQVRLVAQMDPATVLTSSERVMTQVLATHGGIVHRSRFHRVCVAERGMKPVTFETALGGMLFQVTAGVCTLTGRSPSPAQILQAQAARIASVRTQLGQAWLPDGRLRLEIRAGDAFIRTGVLSLPRQLHDRLPGELRLAPTAGPPCTLRTRTTTPAQWGYGPLIRVRGLEAGDVLVIAVRPGSQEAELVSISRGRGSEAR